MISSVSSDVGRCHAVLRDIPAARHDGSLMRPRRMMNHPIQRLLTLLSLATVVTSYHLRLLRPAAPDTNPWGGSPDMDAVISLRADGGDASFSDKFLAREQGFYQQLLAVDASDTPIACAHLGRLAIGGYLVLRSDFLISTVCVEAARRREGIGTSLIAELLHRVPKAHGSAWALADGDDTHAQSFLLAAGGTQIGGLTDVTEQNALVAAALAISGGALFRGSDAQVFQFKGQGDCAEYDNVGRLERPPPSGSSSSSSAAPSNSLSTFVHAASSRRQAFAAALVASACLHPMRVGALATAEEEQELLVRHVARFARTRARPSCVETALYKGQPIRQLVATVNLRAHTRVAAYPVEVASVFDGNGRRLLGSEYGLLVYRKFVQRDRDGSLRQYEREFEDLVAVPTQKSLRRAYVDGLPTIAMFANEPDAAHSANCELIFPSTTAARLRLGDVHYAYLATTVPVSVGEPLTACYGESYFPREYPTSCDPRLRE